MKGTDQINSMDIRGKNPRIILLAITLPFDQHVHIPLELGYVHTVRIWLRIRSGLAAADSQQCTIRFTVPSKPMENQIRCAHGTDKYTYLGLEIHRSGSFKQAIETLKDKACKTFYAIRRNTYHLKPPVRVWLKIFDSIIAPILLDGSEVWGPHTVPRLVKVKQKNQNHSEQPSQTQPDQNTAHHKQSDKSQNQEDDRRRPGGVEPKIKISLMSQYERPHTKQHILLCNVYGFFPSEIKVKWYRNDEEQTEQVEFTEPHHNGDWSYQMEVMLETEIQKGDTFTCEVHHESLKDPHRVNWHPESSDSAKNKMATGIVGIVLGLVFFIVGLVIYMRGRKVQASFPGHQNERKLFCC
ncbi:unnamed protein product [Ranitomeya imitator]|uniref:Ig-like domain-containing protein n=1 Tax=Ranitomeya imitator TaxID=111125 RepID=A0ABN9MHD2_9NEOB|nr:unnamed protein product [Ranitomeya imitator]